MSMKNVFDQAFYPDVSDNWDDEAFRREILSRVKPTDRVLDIGAGAGIVSAMNFRGLVAEVVGVDPDPRVLRNPFLDRAVEGVGDRMAFEDDAFDLVFADNVMEHVDAPVQFLEEVRRVLKPGGLFMFKTPNVKHYMPTIARMTPTSFHRWVNKHRGRDESDTFPTRYRFNSASTVASTASKAGFNLEQLSHIESRPEYLRRFGPVYLFGAAYERAVNSSPRFESFRVVLIGVLRKPLAA